MDSDMSKVLSLANVQIGGFSSCATIIKVIALLWLLHNIESKSLTDFNFLFWVKRKGIYVGKSFNPTLY